ncbi:MAG: hypothetical protein QGG46_10145 [Gammaproteobacteria bacterium]|nr:hypothetical protein [Gammaproteobacteria bacterium]
MFLRLTILCWAIIIGIIPIISVVSWMATDDTKVFIMIPGALVFVGIPWLLFWFIRLVISGRRR